MVHGPMQADRDGNFAEAAKAQDPTGSGSFSAVNGILLLSEGV